MKEKPIICRAHEVRAILEGRKTQTRRVVKLPHENPLGHWEPFLFGGQGCRDSKGREISGQMTISHTRTGEVIGCPYGQPGDRLWVRETWAETDRGDGTPVVTYAAGGCIAVGRENATAPDALIHAYAWQDTPLPDRWRPSIHMPRWASRIDLEVTGVRVERLQDISEADAIAEGAEPNRAADHDNMHLTHPYRRGFFAVWESINGKPHIERDDSGREIARHDFGWDANPWVWVVDFRRIRP